ncbi:MAG: hypothetical protein QG574_4156 [Cyanobacteriota bacterium erpe_2018_sw_21hr_WHONDRS-SW48-000092_B_bin.40]|jgi:hypothetical protein|nr:hypothetical protein [Cyanobacteriota bacterium erpe_2018_sw_21hr_WHONDRS-SW48-000092_B_bin.40]
MLMSFLQKYLVYFRRFAHWVLSIFLFFIGIFSTGGTNQALCAQPKAAGKTIPAVRFYQTHYFMGTEQLTVSQNAMRLDNTAQLRFTLLAKAPDWKITIYRPDDKTYFTEDLKEFQETGLLSDLLIGRKDRIVTDRPMRASTMMLNGFKIERLTSPWTTMKFIKLDGIGAPQTETILYATYKLPTNGGIPLTFVGTHGSVDFITGMKNKGSRETNLDTTKIEKVTVPANFFSLPPGLKKAASIRDVVSGRNNRNQSEAVDEMFTK